MEDGFIATPGISLLDRSGRHKGRREKMEGRASLERSRTRIPRMQTSRASGGSSRGSRYWDENIVNLAKGRFGRLSHPRAFSSRVNIAIFLLLLLSRVFSIRRAKRRWNWVRKGKEKRKERSPFDRNLIEIVGLQEREKSTRVLERGMEIIERESDFSVVDSKLCLLDRCFSMEI